MDLFFISKITFQIIQNSIKKNIKKKYTSLQFHSSLEETSIS